MIRFLLALLLLFAAGCDRWPRDSGGTFQRVESRGQIRVGIIADGNGLPQGAREFLSRIAGATKAVPVIERGSGEVLLARLERGGLDLVLGEFHSSSPWSKRVTFVPPLKDLATDAGGIAFAAAARNGENEWISFLHDHGSMLGGRR